MSTRHGKRPSAWFANRVPRSDGFTRPAWFANRVPNRDRQGASATKPQCSKN
jgi:hypothetical protein